MTNEDLYEIWRPKDSLWSPWVKSVVFPFLRPRDHAAANYSILDWHVPQQPATAVIADLPGDEGVSAGISLARAGYRPVLVYNACPSAFAESESPGLGLSGSHQPVRLPMTVDMSAILAALCAAAEQLVSLSLPEQAPPVFLLDANRYGGGGLRGPGWFDNRSFVSPSDFPSADYFRRHGIAKLILLQPTAKIESDLLQVLLPLQRNGMSIAAQIPWQPWHPRPIVVKPPALFVSVGEWFRRRFDYRRDSFPGSFGGLVPPSSS